MGQASPTLRRGTDHLTFWCPGCESPHSVRISEGGWTFEGTVDRPSFTPSILVTSGHYMAGHQGRCWCDYNREHPDDRSFECSVCHSYVTDGQIQFLGDCTHHLVGQTVPLPELPLHMRDGR